MPHYNVTNFGPDALLVVVSFRSDIHIEAVPFTPLEDFEGRQSGRVRSATVSIIIIILQRGRGHTLCFL